MPRALLPLMFALAMAASAAPGVTAQPASGLIALHEVADDGYTYVGNLNHFGYILLENGMTTVHKQGCIRVEQNGAVLYETTPDASHDYDALNTFAYSFARPGPYKVTMSVPSGECANAATVATVEGIVEERPLETVDIELTGPPLVGALIATPFTLEINDANGTLVPHSDVLLEVRRPADRWLLFRTHLHIHDEPIEFCLAFPESDLYILELTAYNAYPSNDSRAYASEMELAEVQVTNSGIPPATGCGPDADCPASMAGGTTSPSLLATADPYDSNTPFSRSTLSAVALDPATDDFARHVNYEAFFVDYASCRTLFYSKNLHEYDGNYDLTVSWPHPGRYALIATANAETVIQPLTIAEVLPPGGIPAPTSAGAVIITAEGLDGFEALKVQRVKFDAKTVAGTAAQHSEIDFQILSTNGRPILQNKLHSHGSGHFEIDLAFPWGGDYELRLDPLTIHGDPTPKYYFGDLGGSLSVPITVTGPEYDYFPRLPSPPAPNEANTHSEHYVLPGPGLAVALVGVAACLATVARRR